jgi:L-histidine N-alpha-methyltransferase
MLVPIQTDIVMLENITQTITSTSASFRAITKRINKETINDSLRWELIHGLLAPQKYISSKFFYDDYGSRLFEWITQLPEYYPTRTEKSIIQNNANELFAQLSHINLIELGSGDCSKISLVLKAITPSKLSNITYYPIDFSPASIEQSKNELKREFPELEVKGIAGDFTQLKSLPNEQPRIICFFGSTIGNFETQEAEKLLNGIQEIMNPGDQLILGLDMVKDISVIEAAYNDSQRITEAFNKNILRACNKLIDTDFFIPDFDHLAFFNKELNRIEMHLVANTDIEISSPWLKQNLSFKQGDRIHTENSQKYTKDMIQHLANKSHLHINKMYTDKNSWFSIIQLMK